MSTDLRKYLHVALSLLAALVVIMFFAPRKSFFSYDYNVGDKWRYETLYADFNFPIIKTDAQVANDIGSEVSGSVPCYDFLLSEADNALAVLDTASIPEKTKSDIRVVLSDMYKVGIIADNARISVNQDIFVLRDKRLVKCQASDIYRISDARERLLQIVGEEYVIAKGLAGIIRANLIFNAQLTDRMKDDNAGQSRYSDGVVSSGDLIVRQGELITPEVGQILDSYRAEYNSSELKPTVTFMLLYAIVVLLLLIILFLVVNIICPEYIGNSSFLYILTIFVLFTVVVLLIARKDEYLLLMIPFTLIALLLQAFFPPKLVIPVYFVCLLPMTMLTYLGAGLFILFAIPGIVSVYLFKYFCRGWKQFLLALIIFAIVATLNFASSLGGRSMTHGITPERRFLYLFVGSFLTVAGYPLVYLFEKIFNLLSNSRLIELSDTSSALLRQLESKAPGTMQHSMQVMNMADFVARSIGANSLLLRAGALYHDIGKMNNPMCFVENESMLALDSEHGYHSTLTPLQSAGDIIKHVSDGVEIAEKHNLPNPVIDFIRSHHGTSLVRFFYAKHIMNGGSESDEELFRYHGVRPRSKEQVILMLCDGLEAASRTLKDHSPEAFDAFITEIFDDKFNDEQFIDADISLRELKIIKESLKTYLAQMYHERIAYPNRKDINNK